jgi:RND family efflux transporter MFP subunit
MNFQRSITAPLILSLAFMALGSARAADVSTLTVGVVKVDRTVVAQEAVFDAELRPFQEISLHSRVGGYLESLKVDAGDLVKAGQLIATVEVPELKDEILHAEAMLRRSQAEVERAAVAAEEAKQAHDRLIAVDKSQPQVVARQDLDTAKARNHTAQAAMAAAREQVKVNEADIKKLKTMLGYSQITAPFDGVITKRYVDPGALIQAGTSSSALPLVRLSQSQRLRVVFPVSLSFVSKVQVGDKVEVRVATLNRAISGKVARTSRKVETATRTMEVEIDLPNPDLQLIPGLYATVALQFDRRENVLAVPIEAVARDKKSASVLVVTRDNRIEERAVTLGLETPTKLEIVKGLEEHELVVIGSRSQIKAGQTVQPKLIELTKAE